MEGKITTTEGESEAVESVKGLHHYHFTLLESELEEASGNWFHDLETIMGETEMSGNSARERMYTSVFRDRISEDDIVRIQADMELSDVSTSLELFGGFVTIMGKMERLSELGMGSFSMDDAFEDSELEDMDPKHEKRS